MTSMIDLNQSNQTSGTITVTSFFISIPLISICLLGTLGNCLVILAAYMDKSLRTTSNVFVINLAVADIGVCLFCVSIAAVTIMHDGKWIFGEDMCLAMAMMSHIFCITSMLTLFSFSVYRYYVVTHKNARNLNWKPIIALQIPALWLTAVLFSIPPLLGWGKMTFQPRRGGCYLDSRSDPSFSIFLFVAEFNIPLTIMMFSYYKMFLFIKEHNKKLAKKKVVQNNEVSTTKHGIFSNLRPWRSSSAWEEGASVNTEMDISNYEAGKNNEAVEEHNGVIENDSRRKSRKFLANVCKQRVRPSTISHIGVTVNEIPVQINHAKETSIAVNVSVQASAANTKSREERNIDVNVSVQEFSTKFVHKTDKEEDVNGQEQLLEVARESQATLAPSVSEREQELKVKQGIKITDNDSSSVESKSSRVKTITEKSVKKDMKLLKILLVTVVVFVLCWTPYALDSLLEAFGVNDERPYALQMTELSLAFGNSCCNPFIYAAMNIQFRKTFGKILKRIFCCKNSV